ncbi:MAG: ABC transporter permease [Nitrospinae bacterium]|nr:ABC transporter permease [Nitrospinota bacterium]
MGRYIVRRLRSGLISLWLITLAVFLLLRLTGDPVDFLVGPEISQADRERMKAHYGLDKPLYVQYLLFNKSIFTGDFGKSLRWAQRDAFDVFVSRLPASVQLVGAALAFSMLLGLPFGVISGTKPDSWLDRIGKVLAITGQSMPSFWLGLLFILLFTVYLGWLPSAGGLDRIGLKGLIMPAVSLGWFLVAANTRLVRSAMLDALNSDYIKMVRAKGMPRRAVIWKHALKNTALPVITLFAVNVARLVGGAVVTEAVFAWPGIGNLLVDAVHGRDFNLVQIVVFFSAATIVVVNILVDLCYTWLDPRVRLE